MFSNFFSENRAFYEVIWKNMVEPDRPHDNTVWPMRFSCWISKATGTHSEYVIRIAFSRQQWLRERSSMLCLYLHCLSFFFRKSLMHRILLSR
jgi:hypothetical protein